MLELGLVIPSAAEEVFDEEVTMPTQLFLYDEWYDDDFFFNNTNVTWRDANNMPQYEACNVTGYDPDKLRGPTEK